MPQIVIPRPMAPALTTPLELPNLAAWYSTEGIAGDSTYIKDGSNRVTLIADRSRNSSVNVLALNGTGGNYASTPAQDLSGTQAEWVFHLQMPDYTPASYMMLMSQDDGAAQRAFYLTVEIGGTIQLVLSADGSNSIGVSSSTTIPLTDLLAGWIKTTWRASDGRVQFFTAVDSQSEPAVWNQLGTDKTIAIAGIFNSSRPIEVGLRINGTTNPFLGLFYSAIFRKTIGGSNFLNFNPSGAAKLSASFIAPVTGETWTINSGGDLGARICGARDLYQGTTAKQPIFSTGADGRNRITLDGSNDYMRSAPFALAQPDSITAALSLSTWTSGRYVFDGGAGANTAGLVMTTGSPQVNLNAGSSVAGNTNLAVGTRAIISAIFNGASSSLVVNRTTATTGDAGAGTPNGITLGANGASTAASFGNVTVSEMVARSAADDGLSRSRLIAYEAPKWGVTL